MGFEVNREGGLDWWHSDESFYIAIAIFWLKLLQRDVRASPLDRASQLLEGRHVEVIL